MYNREMDEDLQRINIDEYNEKNGDLVKEPKKRKKNKTNSLLKEVLINSLYLLIVMIGTLMFVKYVAQRTVVNGDSMKPTLYNEDNLIVDKISYQFNEPERFDIVVFPYEYKKNTFYIKRIIGLPGENIRIDTEGHIYINEVLLEENYGAEVIKEPGNALNGITLGADQYFVLGDNRNHSSDSRTAAVGVVSRDKIIGKAWVRIYPFDKIEVLGK